MNSLVAASRPRKWCRICRSLAGKMPTPLFNPDNALRCDETFNDLATELAELFEATRVIVRQLVVFQPQQL